MDERIEKAKRLLLVKLALVCEQTLRANVYVLTADGRHEWVPVEALSVADAAELVRDLRDREHARGAKVSFEVQRSDWDSGYRGEGRDALLRDLGSALYEKGVAFSPAELQM